MGSSIPGAFAAGRQWAEGRLAEKSARQQMLSDEERRNKYTFLQGQIQPLKDKIATLKENDPEFGRARQALDQVNQQIFELYHPTKNPGALHRDLDWLFSSLIKKRPQKPVLQKSTTPGTEATTVSLPAQDQTIPLSNGKSIKIPASLMKQDVALGGTPVETSVAVNRSALTPEQMQRMKRLDQAKEMTEMELAGSSGPGQEKVEEAQQEMAFINSLPPDKQHMAMQLLGIRVMPNLKNFRNTQTGEVRTVDINQENPGPEWVLSGTSAGVARSLGAGISPMDAITAMHVTGQKYLKPDGTPYTEEELNQLPPYLQLRQYAVGSNIYYGLEDQTQHTVTFGNVMYRMDQFGNVDVEHPIGQVKTGSVTTQTAPGGQQVVTGTTTPKTILPGAPLPAATPGTPAQPAAAPGAVPGAPVPKTNVPRTMVTSNPKGLVEPGNIPIDNRPVVRNADGTHSSEYSVSFDQDGKEVLLPTVVNGKFLTPDGKKPQPGSPAEKAMFEAAWRHYVETGENLGKFDNAEDANAYAQQLHNRGNAGPHTPASLRAEMPRPSHAAPAQQGASADLKAAEEQGVLPNIQAMTPRNAALATKAQPAASALMGIYGDPTNPTSPSLMNYAPLADDPHAQQTLGAAFQLLDQHMGEITDPGILATLATAGGWANFRAGIEAQAQQQAGVDMTPDEQQYFDAAISAMADIIGSRAATGQSAARFSVRSIQNELPLIGLSGTPNQTSYLTKLETISRQVMVGLNALPDNKRALAWLRFRMSEIAKTKAALAATQALKVQKSKSGEYRYSTDGGKTWQPGLPPIQKAQ